MPTLHVVHDDHARIESPAEEITRLRRCVSDLASIVALPAPWTDGEPSEIANTLLDALVGMLPVAFVFVRVNDPDGGSPIEIMRVAAPMDHVTHARDLGHALDVSLGSDALAWPSRAQACIGDVDLSMASARLGVNGEIGIIVAGSCHVDFPGQTDRLLLDVAANKAAMGLQRARCLDVLTASIAHEINQPLTGIVTNASACLRMLAANPPNIDGARETARRTIRDGNRASEVVARLRALFSQKALTTESLDLNEATREALAQSSSELQRNRVIVRANLADDLPPVAGDRIQLQQVILNLLRNASDAMAGVHDRPRQLLIETTREDGDRVRLTVRDAGIGVDRQSLDRLFDAFYTTKRGGMGIGLSVSRSIIERHRGRLWAEPNDGPGVTFSFSIPRGSRAHRRFH